MYLNFDLKNNFVQSQSILCRAVLSIDIFLPLANNNRFLDL